MKITGFDCWRVPIGLEEPYTIAYATYDHAVNVFCQIVTDTGLVGFGCAAPDEHVTGETPEAVEKALRHVEPFLRGADPMHYAFLNEQIQPHLGMSAMAAVDIALHDLIGKYFRVPLWKLWGGQRTSYLTSITIGILSLQDTVSRAVERVREGFKSLKIKGGLNVEDDIARLISVREAVGPSVELRFDANQGYITIEAIKFSKETLSVGLSFVEQPTPKYRMFDLRSVMRESRTPIMADECVCTPENALELASTKGADLINLKLMKLGGIRSTAKINTIAESASIPCMIGCMDESALSIAAALHLALASPNIRYVDLDGHIGMMGDPGASAVRCKDGTLYPVDAPGFGLEVI